MATVEGADKYFMHTTRYEQWVGFTTERQRQAVDEAAALIARLVLSRTPPASAMDNAAYEQALCILQTQDMPVDATEAIMSGVVSRSLDGASESYQKATDMPNYFDGVLLCPHAISWLGPYLNRHGVRKGRIVCR